MSKVELTPEQKLENMKEYVADCERISKEDKFKSDEAWVKINSLISEMIGDLVILSTNIHQAYVIRDPKRLKEVGNTGHQQAWEFANRYTDLEGRLTWSLESANTYEQLTEKAKQEIQELEKAVNNETTTDNDKPSKG